MGRDSASTHAALGSAGTAAGELRRWTAEIVAVLTVLAIIIALGAGAAHSETTNTPVRAGSQPTVHRGLSRADAAPSCWAIKQSFPGSRSGVYWLQTAQLVVPNPYYCDMTTNGGGWVLIGRGREGWTFDWHGQGTSSSIRTSIAGRYAYEPAALSSETVIGLLGGQRVQTLADGVRLRRAANAIGTAWQEVRLRFNSMGQFTWNFDSGQPLRSVAFDATSAVVGPSGHWYKQSTFDVRLDAARQLVHTGPLAEQHNVTGFAYGRSITGMRNSTSALWSATNGGPYALPFTQVWVRPKVADTRAGFARVADTGLPAITQPRLPTTKPQHVDWGVIGVQKPVEDPDPVGDSPVYGLAQVGSTMFVGGKFAKVEHHSVHTTADQPWLAAFDVQTGVWRSGFRPALDGAVFDLAATPDGKLVVAGNFTNVNGAPNTAGLAVLDPTTGAVVSGWHATLSHSRFGTVRPYARAVDIQGSWLYVVGSFNSVQGGGADTTVATGGLARVALTDGTPDPAFHGFFDRTPWDVDASPDGARVYLAGYFTKYGTSAAMTSTAHSFTAVSTTDAEVIWWLALPWFNSDVTDQLSTLEYGESVFHGGQSRWIARYDRDTLAFTRGIEMNPHGDVQVIAGLNGVVFAGCHCLGKSLADNKVGITRSDAISWVGAWDPVTMDRYPGWVPQWKTAETSEGGWELAVDSEKCLWVGGDFIEGATSADWLGGFARLCPSDSTAPRKPTRFDHSGMRLTWAASVDNSGVRPTYEILRNDRVVATTTGTSYLAPGSGRWFVRAVDRAGNRSVSSSVIAL